MGWPNNKFLGQLRIERSTFKLYLKGYVILYKLISTGFNYQIIIHGNKL